MDIHSLESTPKIQEKTRPFDEANSPRW